MRFLLGVLMLMISGSALATIDVLQFKDEAQEQQFRQLTEELRCPKCQNNSIADSNSMIATDLLRQLRHLRPAVNAADRSAVGATGGGYWHWRLGYLLPLTASGTRGAGRVS